MSESEPSPLLPRKTEVRKKVAQFYISGDLICFGFGDSVISKAKCKRTGAEVVVKQIPLSAPHKEIRRRLRHAARQEFTLCSQLHHHPNIIKCLETFTSREEAVLVLEYCVAGDMLEYILHRGALPEDKARLLCNTIGSALHLCHQNGIAHRDVKLENIYLRADGTPVLGDFGMAHRYVRGQRFTDRTGSPPYMAPEMNDDPLSVDPEAADMFAFGVVLYAVLKACWPYDHQSHSAWLDDLRAGRYDLSAAEGFSQSLVVLLASMLKVEPSERPSFDEILQNKWCIQ